MNIPDHVPEEIRQVLETKSDLVASQEGSWSKQWLQRDLDDMLRLVADDRMRDVFDILEVDNFSPEQRLDFVMAAINAKDDYDRYKVRLAEAKELLKRIVNAVPKLEILVQQLCDTGVYLPPELISPRATTTVPFGPDEFDTNLKAARAVHFMKKMDITGTGPEMDDLARTLPPDVLSILHAVVEACEGATDASLSQHFPGKIQTRQRNPKNDFIRAFARGLEKKEISRTDSIERAIAITTGVALDLDVTAHDVRTALARPKPRPH